MDTVRSTRPDLMFSVCPLDLNIKHPECQFNYIVLLSSFLAVSCPGWLLKGAAYENVVLRAMIRKERLKEGSVLKQELLVNTGRGNFAYYHANFAQSLACIKKTSHIYSQMQIKK